MANLLTDSSEIAANQTGNRSQIKRMVLSEGHLMEVIDWNDGKRRAENGIEYQKKIIAWPPFFLSDLFRCGRNRKQ